MLPAAPIYRPRHPERSALYRLFQDHFDRFALEYEERFEHRHGPLRRVILRLGEEPRLFITAFGAVGGTLY